MLQFGKWVALLKGSQGCFGRFLSAGKHQWTCEAWSGSSQIFWVNRHQHACTFCNPNSHSNSMIQDVWPWLFDTFCVIFSVTGSFLHQPELLSDGSRSGGVSRNLKAVPVVDPEFLWSNAPEKSGASGGDAASKSLWGRGLRSDATCGKMQGIGFGSVSYKVAIEVSLANHSWWHLCGWLWIWKENPGCVASGAYRYRKITLPGNPKARTLIEALHKNRVWLYDQDVHQISWNDRQPVSLSRMRSNWWFVPAPEQHTDLRSIQQVRLDWRYRGELQIARQHGARFCEGWPHDISWYKSWAHGVFLKIWQKVGN